MLKRGDNVGNREDRHKNGDRKKERGGNQRERERERERNIKEIVSD